VKNYVESKNTVPSTVTVDNKQVTSEQYLYLLTSSVTNLNKNNNNAITVKSIVKAPKPTESLKSGNLLKSEYIKLAGDISTFINTNGRLPNFVDTSKGKMRPENMIYTYSNVVAFYKTNNRLPNYVSITPWKNISGEGSSTPTTPNAPSTPSTLSTSSTPSTNSIDTGSVVNSSNVVKNYVESNKSVPNTVTVAGKNITPEQYLYLLTSSVINLNQNNKNNITIKSIAKAPNPRENVKSGILSKSEYISLANSITAFINNNGRLPNFISTSLGNMRPENLIYTYSKVAAFYKTNNRLPTSVSVTPWSTLKSVSEGSPATIDGIFKTAARYGYSSAAHDAATMVKIGSGDCWAMSDYLFKQLKSANVKARILQYATAYTSNHRSVQYRVNGAWIDVPYRTYGFHVNFRNTYATKYGTVIASC
jgi:ribosomal protein S8E